MDLLDWTWALPLRSVFSMTFLGQHPCITMKFLVLKMESGLVNLPIMARFCIPFKTPAKILGPFEAPERVVPKIVWRMIFPQMQTTKQNTCNFWWATPRFCPVRSTSFWPSWIKKYHIFSQQVGLLDNTLQRALRKTSNRKSHPKMVKHHQLRVFRSTSSIRESRFLEDPEYVTTWS